MPLCFCHAGWRRIGQGHVPKNFAFKLKISKKKAPKKRVLSIREKQWYKGGFLYINRIDPGVFAAY